MFTVPILLSFDPSDNGLTAGERRKRLALEALELLGPAFLRQCRRALLARLLRGGGRDH
jgi:hypothetical protein